MASWRDRWTDQRVEEVISVLLRTGVTTAAVVVLAGGLFYLRHFGATSPHYQHFLGEPPQLHTVAGILAALRMGDPRAIIQFGLVLLILTPIARVIFSVVGFSLQRDRLYVVLTLIVLVVLVVNLFWV